MQGRTAEAEGAAGPADADAGANVHDDHDVVTRHREHTQADPEQAAGGPAALLAADDPALRADRAGTSLRRRHVASAADAALGADATHCAARHRRRRARREGQAGAVHAL